MTGLRLATVTMENVRAACDLELRPGQEGLVAPVAVSLACAYAVPAVAWPRLIYDGDDLAGFVMAAFDPGNPDELYHAYLWRLNISGEGQGRGYGRFAVEALAREARRRGHSRLTVSYHAGEHGPEGFYQRLGFRPTGAMNQGEVVAELLLAPPGIPSPRGEVTIREAAPADAGAVAALAGELALSFAFRPESFAASFPALLASGDACLLVAAAPDGLAGYLLGFWHPAFYAGGPVAWVEEILVRGEDRGRGVGRALMADFEKRAAQRDCRLVALATRRAEPFYLALGYQASASYLRKVLQDPADG